MDTPSSTRLVVEFPPWRSAFTNPRAAQIEPTADANVTSTGSLKIRFTLLRPAAVIGSLPSNRIRRRPSSGIASSTNTKEYGFTPWVTSLLDNHYHTLGYLREGANLPKMMQRFHGSVAKLVNDLLPERRADFWRDAKGREYFDGCIRNEKQARLAYRYTLVQGQRHGLVRDWRGYLHTRVNVELELAIRRALEINAFLEGVPYKRYLK
jgi:hypothetical protein